MCAVHHHHSFLNPPHRRLRPLPANSWSWRSAKTGMTVLGHGLFKNCYQRRSYLRRPDTQQQLWFSPGGHRLVGRGDPNAEINNSSLPLNVWDPPMPHDTGRTSAVCSSLPLRAPLMIDSAQWLKLRLRGDLSTLDLFMGCATRVRSPKMTLSRESGFELGWT